MTGGANGAPATLYSFSLGYAPDSNVTTANDSVNGNWTYSYDAFNRLVGSNQNGGAAIYSYDYDRFGNRWHQNGPNSMMLSFSGSNNRMDGYSYDAAGNLVVDNVNNRYTYDAEGRIVMVVSPITGTSCYVYNADGQRVRKTTGSTNSCGTPATGTSVDYLYDFAGIEITELSSTGSWNRGEVYAGERHLATYNLGTTYFNHSDWLGTERVRSSTSGSPCETMTSLPFGDGQTTSGSCVDASPMHFTGQERDSESGLDNFGARYYGSSMGRFMSPDPAGIFVADVSVPQSWNLYSYVQNNPLNAVDPFGLNCVWDDGSYDAEDDPVTGSISGCEKQGGTWFDDIKGDWNSKPNSDLAKQIADAQAATNDPNTTRIKVDVHDNSDLSYIFAISDRLMPLNKLSDCTGTAVVNQIPFVGTAKKLLGIPEERDPLKSGLEGADRLNKAAEFFSENKKPARVVWGLNKANLPMLSAAAEKGSTKIVPHLAPYASTFKFAGYAFTAGIASYETYACYNKPGG
jgi:RHS repeat-associated protein